MTSALVPPNAASAALEQHIDALRVYLRETYESGDDKYIKASLICNGIIKDRPDLADAIGVDPNNHKNLRNAMKVALGADHFKLKGKVADNKFINTCWKRWW